MEIGATFYPFLREITQKNGALLIYDEIVTGFRIATAGAQEYFNVVPDLSVFAKGMANGMPLSVFCGKAEIMDVMSQGAAVSSTNGGETLSLAVCKAVVELYRKENVTAYLWKVGEKLWTSVNKIFENTTPCQVKGFYCPTFRKHGRRPKDLTSRILRAAFARRILVFNVLCKLLS